MKSIVTVAPADRVQDALEAAPQVGFSIALGESAAGPATHFGGHIWLGDDMAATLETALDGIGFASIEGEGSVPSEHFATALDLLGLTRVEEEI